MPVDVRPASGDDRAYAESLLRAADLPTQGVRSGDGRLRIYVATDGAARLGVGGLAVRGTAGLLRSLVVEPDARGNGVGTAIRSAIEAEARAAGLDRLYLLTTTAADFFADAGYGRIDRDEAPTAIRETAEFGALCPATAVCMRRRL